MESGTWLPLTEFALRKGISISTLRRKIKTNAIPFKMDEGRYLILDQDVQSEGPHAPSVFLHQSTDLASKISPSISQAAEAPNMDLHWKAIEARVAGLARKVDLMAEQMSELKMLVQIFEEKLEQPRD